MSEVRVCVKATESGFKIDRQDATVANASEIIERVLMHVRYTSFVIPHLEEDLKGSVEEFSNIVEEKQHKVCIVADLHAERVQYSIVGMTKWGASELLSVASAYLKALLVGTIVEE